MKKLSSVIKITLMVLSFMIVVGVNTTQARALESTTNYDSSIDIPDGQERDVSDIVSKVKPSGVLELKGTTLTFKSSKYFTLTSKEKSEFMQSALGNIKASNLSNITKNRVYNFVYERDSSTAKAVEFMVDETAVNFTWAMKLLRGTVGDKISKILGVFCILVFGFIGLGMMWDIAYLALPMFSGILNGLASGDVSSGLGGFFKGAINHRGGATNKPFGVSAVAWKVNREIDLDVNEDRSAIKVYMSRRVPELVICGVCLGYVVTGELFGLVGWMIDNFSFL